MRVCICITFRCLYQHQDTHALVHMGVKERGREGEAGREEEEDMEVEREGGEVKVPLSCVEGHLS